MEWHARTIYGKGLIEGAREGGKGVAVALAGCVHGSGGGGALLACSPVFCLQRCTPHHTHTPRGEGPGQGRGTLVCKRMGWAQGADGPQSNDVLPLSVLT